MTLGLISACISGPFESPRSLFHRDPKALKKDLGLYLAEGEMDFLRKFNGLSHDLGLYLRALRRGFVPFFTLAPLPLIIGMVGSPGFEISVASCPVVGVGTAEMGIVFSFSKPLAGLRTGLLVLADTSIGNKVLTAVKTSFRDHSAHHPRDVICSTMV